MVLAGLGGVGAHKAVPDLVQQVGRLAHFVGLTDSPAPRVVDHEEPVSGHADRLSGQGDDRGDGRGESVNLDGDVLAAEEIVDGETVEHRPAGRVDAEVDALGPGRPDGVDKRFCGHAPPTDLVVKVDLSLVVGFCLDVEPGLHGLAAAALLLESSFGSRVMISARSTLNSWASSWA